MATLNDLKKYLHYEFSTGVYTGKDYISFQTKYVNYLRSFCRQNNWELGKVFRNHYSFSCFIKNTEGKYVFFSIFDVRYYKADWYNNILIRRADSEEDCTGHSNHYTSLENLQTNIERLFSYA